MIAGKNQFQCDNAPAWFFIAGAPKCGTTAMYSYLRQHHDLFLPATKEPKYYATDLVDPKTIMSPARYCALYRARKSERYVGDGSANYLYSSAALPTIAQENPTAKIVVILRNPVTMIASLHDQLVYNGDENILDLGDAIDAIEERKAGNKIPPGLRDSVSNLYYLDQADYLPQLERLFKYFPRRQVKTLLYEEFRLDVRGTYRSVLQFLGVDDSFEPTFTVVNPAKSVRVAWIRNYLKRRQYLADWAEYIAGPSFRSWLRSMVVSLNTRYRSRPPMTPELKERLAEHFESRHDELEKMLEVDLSLWRDDSSLPR